VVRDETMILPHLRSVLSFRHRSADPHRSGSEKTVMELSQTRPYRSRSVITFWTSMPTGKTTFDRIDHEAWAEGTLQARAYGR
jgi:hypothetical protein